MTCPGEWNCKTTFVLIISIFEKKDFCMEANCILVDFNVYLYA